MAELDPNQVSAERTAKPAAEYEKIKTKYHEQGMTLDIESLEPVITGAHAVEKAGLDPARWEVVECTAGSWTVPVKNKLPDGTTEVQVVECWKCSVRCKPKLPGWAYEANNDLIDRIKEVSGKLPAVKYPRRKKSQCVLEISIADIHAGKFAIDGKWTLEEFEHVFAKTVDYMLEQCAGRNIVEILLPLGNDMLNVDTAMMTTTKGTPQNGRVTFGQIYHSALWASINAVERCRQVAPVRVIHVPGNHDWSSSRHVVEAVGARFHKTSGVSLDLSEDYGGGRKYYHRGNVLIGYSHGNNEKMEDLPGIMAAEVPQLWAASTCREYHVGHRHFRHGKRKQYSVLRETPYKEHGGVMVRQLPSISPDDHYHKIHGYVGSARMNEGFLFDLEYGSPIVIPVSFEQIMGVTTG